MNTATVTAQFPCHTARKYDRTCPECGAVYVIDRVTLVERPGMRIDEVTWDPA